MSTDNRTQSDQMRTHNADEWSKNTSTYARIIELMTQPRATSLVSRAFTLLPPDQNSHVLDNGCGTGVITQAVKDAFPDIPVTASDTSTGMLQKVREKGFVGVTTRQADALNLRASGLESGSFTHALSSFCLQFTSDPDRGLAEMAGVVGPGGLVAAMTWGELGIFAVVERLFREQQPEYRLPEEVWRSVWRTTGDVEEGMRRAGLEVLVSEVEDAPWTWMTVDDLEVYLFGGANPLAEEVAKGFTGDMNRVKKEFRKLHESGQEFPKIDVLVTIGKKRESR